MAQYTTTLEEVLALRSENATLRKALEITLRMIAGEMIENAVIDVQTGQSLGEVIRSALAGVAH